MSGGFVKDLIYDVGLHRGEDSEFYLKKGFRVVAIEAHPDLAQVATERLREYLDSGRLVILNLAIAGKDGPVPFFENLNVSVWGTTDPEWAARNQRLGAGSTKITVQGVNFRNILRRYGVPYYLKVDIEGADLLCLEALRSFELRPKYMSIESTKTSWEGLRKEFLLFRELGYSMFKVIPQHNINTQFCPFPAREGLCIGHHFESGSSGLFGEELPWRWMTESEAIWRYRPIFVRYKLFGDDGILRPLARFRSLKPGWYDTHAMIP